MSSDLIQRLTRQKERQEKAWNEVADEIGITSRTLREYRNGGSPSPASKKKIRRWLGDTPDGEGQPYSGPADAEQDPHEVAADYLQSDSEGEARSKAAFSEGKPADPDVRGATARTDFDPQQAIQEQKRRYRQKHKRAEKKKRQAITFDTGPVAVVFVGDQHIGNAGTDIERVFEEQDIILETPATYAWQLGDVVDNFIVGRLKEQNMKPSAPVWEQWQLAQHYLDRYSDEQKLLAHVGGNHGAWTMGQTQIDYRRDITPDGVLYDGDEVKADVKVGRARFPVWTRHKWRGNSIYNQTHGQERAARFQDPQYRLYVGAHTHDGGLYREFIHEGRRKASVQIGAYKQHDDYAQKAGFPETDGSTAVSVILYPDGSMHGMADLDAMSRYMNALYGRPA